MAHTPWGAQEGGGRRAQRNDQSGSRGERRAALRAPGQLWGSWVQSQAVAKSSPFEGEKQGASPCSVELGGEAGSLTSWLLPGEEGAGMLQASRLGVPGELPGRQEGLHGPSPPSCAGWTRPARRQGRAKAPAWSLGRGGSSRASGGPASPPPAKEQRPPSHWSSRGHSGVCGQGHSRSGTRPSAHLPISGPSAGIRPGLGEAGAKAGNGPG